MFYTYIFHNTYLITYKYKKAILLTLDIEHHYTTLQPYISLFSNSNCFHI